MDMKLLKNTIKEHIEEALDHKNLNVEVPFFKTVNPTAENMAVMIWDTLRPHIHSSNALSVTLYETPRNYVQYSGD